MTPKTWKGILIPGRICIDLNGILEDYGQRGVIVVLTGFSFLTTLLVILHNSNQIQI